MEIPLIPIAVFGLWWLRTARSRDVLDVVAGDRHESSDPLGPQGRDDASGPSTPIVAGEDRIFQIEGVNQVKEIVTERRLLTRARRSGVAKPGWSIAAQIGNNDPKAGSGQRRCNLVIGMNVVGKAVQQHDGTTIRRASFLVGDLED